MLSTLAKRSELALDLSLSGGQKTKDLYGSERQDATIYRQSYNHSTSLLGVGVERR